MKDSPVPRPPVPRPARRKARSTEEKQTQNAILRTFGTRSDMRLWRNNRGVGFYGDRAVVYGVPGQADISGILSDGRRLEIETKSSTGTLSTDQKNFRAIIERFNGLYILARSVADVTTALKEGGYL